MTEELIQLQRAPHITRSIDNTALNDYMSCPRKYYYSMVLNRRRGGATRPALAYGTCWHAILETHYKTGGDEDAVVKAAVASWEQHDNPDDHRTLQRCVTAYGAYLKKWGTHDEEVAAWGRTVGFPESPIVEQPTEIWWIGALHPYTGKIDRIYEHNGAYYVEDHKTTSALGAKYFQQFDPSNQMMGYAWLAHKLTGLPIAGVRINAHGVLKTENKFERQPVLFSPERLEEWTRNLNSWIGRLEDSHAEALEAGLTEDLAQREAMLLHAFPHNFNACAAKYGQCTYDEVCTSSPRIRQRILENDFDLNPWDPMSLDEEVPE